MAIDMSGSSKLKRGDIVIHLSSGARFLLLENALNGCARCFVIRSGIDFFTAGWPAGSVRRVNVVRSNIKRI
jgi:hypothetical protein